MEKQKYIFLNKALFFPEQGILTIGDLHIGYEEALVQSGVLLPEQQVEETIFALKSLVEEVKARDFTLKKVVFLGDIKHMFGYDWKEKKNFFSVLDFLKMHVSEKNIIIIKGNHDTMNLGLKMIDFYIEEDVAFVHGHDSFIEIFNNKVKYVVSGHLHPSVILSENPGVKNETYKCFLTGVSQKKNFIVVPSFLDFYEGTPVNYYRENFIEFFSIIPRKDILKFKVHVVSENGDVYDFGKVGDLG